MRFLADESCVFGIVRALRDGGHDVLAVVEISPRAEDPEIIDLAVDQGRLLLTEDKDFGRVVFADQGAYSGVIRCFRSGLEVKFLPRRSEDPVRFVSARITPRTNDDGRTDSV